LYNLNCVIAPPRVLGMRHLRLAGTVSALSLALALNPATVRAANYIASNQAELFNAIALANADGDANSTITLTGNVALTTPSLLPAITKSLTIDTGSFMLSGNGDAVFDTADGQTLTINGATTAGGLVKEGSGTTILSGVEGDQGRTVEVTSGLLQIDGESQITAGLDSFSAPVRVSGGTLLINGAGTTFTVTPGAAASNIGGTAGAHMIIAGGAQFVTPGGFILSNTATESSSLSVSGPGSLFDGTSLSVLQGQSDIAITAGGAIRSSAVGIGGLSSGLYNNGTGTVVVSGAGSAWNNTGAFRFFNGSMDIVAGGSVASSTMHIAAAVNSGAMTANLRVDGTGSQLVTTGTAANAFQIGGGNTSGARSGSLSISNGGSVSVADGSGTINLAQVANARGTINVGGAEGEEATGAGTLAAGLIQFGAGVGAINFNHTDANYRFDTALASGAGMSTINHIGSGKTILTADQPAFTGQSNVRAGILEVNGVLGGSMDVFSGRLQGRGTVGETINHAGGMIAPGNSIGTLTVAGNYISNGGGLEIETVLGGDGSPSDLLVITGDSILGITPTQVGVINLGGAGAPTVEGIKIVDVGGASDPGAFSLNGDYVFEGEQTVVGGAYAYRLYQNGVSTPTDGDWYLRSALLPVPPVVPPVTPPAPPTPLYQAGVPLYESYANVLQSFNALGTLQQRVGNRSWSGNGVAESGEAANSIIQGNGFWGRIEAAHGNFNPSTSTTGAKYDVDLWKLQAGVDGWLYDGEAGRLIGGISGHFGTMSSDVRSIFGDGSISSTGYGLGGTVTWYADNGFYLDGQAQVSWYDSDLSSSTAHIGLTSGNNGVGYGLSVEGGQRIGLGPNWSLTPQVQLAYSEVNFDDFTDAFGASVSLNRGGSLKGRLGLSADYQNEWRDRSGQVSRAHVYGIANLYYDFLDGSQTEVAGVKFSSENDPLWGGVGIGGSYNWSDDKYSLFGEASVDTSLENFGDSYAMRGNAGLRVKF